VKSSKSSATNNCPHKRSETCRSLIKISTKYSNRLWNLTNRSFAAPRRECANFCPTTSLITFSSRTNCSKTANWTSVLSMNAGKRSSGLTDYSFETYIWWLLIVSIVGVVLAGLHLNEVYFVLQFFHLILRDFCVQINFIFILADESFNHVAV